MIEGSLYSMLRSTNTIESLNGRVATYTGNVKRQPPRRVPPTRCAASAEPHLRRLLRDYVAYYNGERVHT